MEPRPAISKAFAFTLACIVLLALGGAAKVYFDHQRVTEDRQKTDSQRLAFLEAREKAATQLRKIAAGRVEDERALTAPASPQKPTDGAAPVQTAASAPAATPAPSPDDAPVREFVARARISSLLLGAPRIVIIDKREYEEGDDIALPNGRRGKISEIGEEGVTLHWEGRGYRIPRR